MSDEIQRAVDALINQAEKGMVESAETIMRESIIECPLSDDETYITEWGTQYRTIGGRVEKFVNSTDEFIEGDEGTLRRSARIFAPIRTPAEISVTFGYGFGEEINPAGRLASEYAVPVHERSDLRHDPPTKDHYLSDPLFANVNEFEASVAKEMRAMTSIYEGEVSYGVVIADGEDLGA